MELPLGTWQRNRYRVLAWYAKARQKLIDELGGKCKRCGAKEKLEFHHTRPRTWAARNLSRWSRLAAYKRDIAAGVIDLLCKSCNSKAGEPTDDTADQGESDF